MNSRAITIVVAIVALWGVPLALGCHYQLRLNLTPSAPIGIWRIVTQREPIGIGQLVFVCLPDAPWVRDAFERGYLRPGLCPSGIAPLIKAVAGLQGQVVSIGKEVAIDGAVLPGSRVQPMDGQGRVLKAFSGGTIPAGQAYLHSSAPTSFDSRYFGPVALTAIEGLAEPLLVMGSP